MSTTSPPDRREMSRSSRSGWWWTWARDRKSTRLNSSHGYISYAAFCLKKKSCLLIGADAEELAQQQVLGVHRDVGLELSLPPALGVLQTQQVVGGGLQADGRGGEIRHRTSLAVSVGDEAADGEELGAHVVRDVGGGQAGLRGGEPGVGGGL